MEWLAVSLIVSFAYVYAPILRVHAARLLHLQMPSGAIAPQAEAMGARLPEVELPEAVERFAASESEKWAQEAARRRARELYSELGDWRMVLVRLEQES